MARYIGPVCRLCRRENTKLFLKGDRCNSSKCSIEKKKGIPGDTQKKRRKNMSEYGIQLREKQKVKRYYGLLEKQYRNLFDKAARKGGITGEIFLSYLERRFDNVVFRLKLASSRKQARQMIGHGLFTINDKKVNIPSVMLRANDEVKIKEKYTNLDLLTSNLEMLDHAPLPEWLEFDQDKKVGKIIRNPEKQDIDLEIEENLIVELYNK